MPTFKKFLAVVALILAIVGIIICLAIVWFSWSLNTPVTDSLVQVTVAADRVLTVADNGLTRVDRGLTVARGIIDIVNQTTQTVGDELVETNLAFVLLERTVGDTLFPRIVAAHETATALTTTVVAFNDALEAANRMPFFDVPTLTDELETAAARLEDARTRVTEIQDTMRTIKEEKVGRPVTFITERTTVINDELGEAQTTVGDTLARIRTAQTRLAITRERLPRWIDLISVVITLAMLWLVATQAYVFMRSLAFLRGRPTVEQPVQVASSPPAS